MLGGVTETLLRTRPQRGWQLSAVLVVAVGIVGGVSLCSSTSGCSSRDAAAATVAALSSELQQAASAGQLSIDTLAGNMRRMNELAAVYESSGDVRTYCEGLDQLRDEFALKQ